MVLPSPCWLFGPNIISMGMKIKLGSCKAILIIPTTNLIMQSLQPTASHHITQINVNTPLLVKITQTKPRHLKVINFLDTNPVNELHINNPRITCLQETEPKFAFVPKSPLKIFSGKKECSGIQFLILVWQQYH